ncbi:alpha/beta hydrolase [Sphingomonas profundi]|uniref:alpha/beta hydrolase n=1 Tax=Alterirhizorhabdus profundi TaxID=2681549 RepID=UPI0012E85DA3|nr:alpha/beta hydrolase [Sphingomonas profundi]
MESLDDRRTRPAGMRLAGAAGHDGWPLRAFDWPAEGEPRGSILFQTGRGDFLEKYLEAFGHWHRRGWTIAGFDWRGQGGSRGAGSAPAAAAALDAMLADVAGFAARWIAESPPPHVLIGHSMGGHLVLRLLAEQAVPVAAAVLVSPMLGLRHAPLSPAIARGVARMAVALGQAGRPLWGTREMLVRQANLTGCADRYADETWWKETQPDLSLGPPDWGWVAAALRSIARLAAPGVLERVTPPVLLIATDRDRLVSAAAIRAATARLPHATLRMIDGAHELLREADGPRLEAFAAIDAFLAAQAPAR